MYPIPGHLSCGLAIRAHFRLNFRVVLAATFLPDLIDKLLDDLWHLVPYGRSVMHNIPVLLLISVAFAAAFRDRRIGYAWAAGHLAHLIADCSFIPWWYPFVQYDWPASPDVVQATADLRYLAAFPPRITANVIRVFQPIPLLMELLMLLLSGYLWWYPTLKKSMTIALTCAFLLITVVRLSLFG